LEEKRYWSRIGSRREILEEKEYEEGRYWSRIGSRRGDIAGGWGVGGNKHEYEEKYKGARGRNMKNNSTNNLRYKRKNKKKRRHAGGDIAVGGEIGGIKVGGRIRGIMGSVKEIRGQIGGRTEETWRKR
jgi:hypothetical protein